MFSVLNRITEKWVYLFMQALDQLFHYFFSSWFNSLVQLHFFHSSFFNFSGIFFPFGMDFNFMESLMTGWKETYISHGLRTLMLPLLALVLWWTWKPSRMRNSLIPGALGSICKKYYYEILPCIKPSSGLFLSCFLPEFYSEGLHGISWYSLSHGSPSDIWKWVAYTSEVYVIYSFLICNALGVLEVCFYPKIYN